MGYVELPGSIYFNTGHGRTFHEVPRNDGMGTVYGLAFATSIETAGRTSWLRDRVLPMASGLARNRPRANTLQPQKTTASRTTCFHPRSSGSNPGPSVIPEWVHIHDAEDQPSPASHGFTLFQIEDRRLSVSCAREENSMSSPPV